MNITGGNALLDVNYIINKAQISEGENVADFGCGASGHFIFASAKKVGKKGKIFAIDILKTVLENISKRAKQENLGNIEAVWSDLEVFGATKIEPSSIDVGLLVNTLYQSKKRVEILRESIRMLKKKSKLVIVEWKNTSSPFGPPVKDRVKKELLEKAVGRLGLQLVEEFDAGQYHYGLVFTKI